MVFYLYSRSKDEERNKELFREYVLAAKSQTINEYVESLPAGKEELPEQPEQEIVELEDVEPEKILKASV